MTIARLLLRSRPAVGRPAGADRRRQRRTIVVFRTGRRPRFQSGSSLRQRGLASGDRVALLGDATPDYLCADYGVDVRRSRARAARSELSLPTNWPIRCATPRRAFCSMTSRARACKAGWRWRRSRRRIACDRRGYARSAVDRRSRRAAGRRGAGFPIARFAQLHRRHVRRAEGCDAQPRQFARHRAEHRHGARGPCDRTR